MPQFTPADLVPKIENTLSVLKHAQEKRFELAKHALVRHDTKAFEAWIQTPASADYRTHCRALVLINVLITYLNVCTVTLKEEISLQNTQVEWTPTPGALVQNIRQLNVLMDKVIGDSSPMTAEGGETLLALWQLQQPLDFKDFYMCQEKDLLEGISCSAWETNPAISRSFKTMNLHQVAAYVFASEKAYFSEGVSLLSNSIFNEQKACETEKPKYQYPR